jgi:hypothetical protein
MKPILQFIFVPIILACLACHGADQITYSYRGFDTNGALVIKGNLNLQISANSNVSGDWNFQAADSSVSDKIRRTAGSGKLVGTLTEKKLDLNLNPEMADNNVMLHGTLTTTNISGTWGHYGCAGLMVGGKFEAVK